MCCHSNLLEGQKEEMAEIDLPQSDAWNAGAGFSFACVLLPIVDINKLITIAYFGVEKIDMQFKFTSQELIAHRFNALQRLLVETKKLMDGTRFMMGGTQVLSKQTKILHKELEDKLKEIKLKNVSKINKDEKTKREYQVLDEDKFTEYLNELEEINAILKYCLNAEGLIFQKSQYLSFEDLKTSIVEEG